MTGIAFSLSKQFVAQGTLHTQITIPVGALLAVVRITVATVDPSATVGIAITYTDFSGINPAPAIQTVALDEVTNELSFVVPVTPTNGIITLSFPVTGTSGAYNALVIFK